MISALGKGVVCMQSRLFGRLSLICLVAFLSIFSQTVFSHTYFSLSNRSPVIMDHPEHLTEKQQGRLIFLQLWDDLEFLSKEPDFYLLVGGLGLSPSIFSLQFKRETPELTELWGHSAPADKLFEFGEIYGDGKFPVIASAMSWGFGKFARSPRLRNFGTDLLRVQAMNGLFTAVMKAGVSRTRPDGAPYSYPSGHSSSAFATAGVIYQHFGKECGIPALVVASYVGLSRLQEGKHFVSDILAGGIMGSYMSWKLVRKGGNTGGISLTPTIIENGLGLSMTFKIR
jgi:membrane-associated phospholipid phosphatase